MKVQVLDHGYLELVETWGSDERIIEAARMSTAKGFLGWGTTCEHCGGPLEPAILHADPTALRCYGNHFKPGCGVVSGKPGDEKLLRFLWENKHATPFEMAGLVIEVQAPIFVFREWHRHRTQSYNELSARYTPLQDVNYIPTVERLMMNAGTSNKQAGAIKDSETLTIEKAERFRKVLALTYAEQEAIYRDALREGIPKELARVHLPVGRYSRMRASANLRNWLAFLTLRSDKNPGAQWEIRQFANALGAIVAEKFPRTWELFK